MKTNEERLDRIEKDIAELKKHAGIEMPDESCPYPLGMTLEFSDDGKEWYPAQLKEYDAATAYPFVDTYGAYWKHSRLPFKWELVPMAKSVIVFDTGAVIPCAPDDPDRYFGSKDNLWGTVIHIEKRPEGV